MYYLFFFLSFFYPLLFLSFGVLLSFFMLNSFCWGGHFIFLDSYGFIMLIIMSLFILGIVLMSEKSMPMILLSECLVFVCVLFFVPGSLIMFYMFFELSVFPILVMILGFGSQIEKINSSYYLMFYAALCSFPFLYIYFSSNLYFTQVYFDLNLSWEMFFILSLSFMMKFPVYFLHLWLPKAHVEASTTASMLLAGLLLKLGTAGFFRIMGSLNFIHNNFWLFLSFIGMILAAFSCVFQSDAKALAAYSSITHMSFLLMSLIFVSLSSKTSSIILMLSHGYTSTLMFYLIGEFYHVSSSRMVYYMNSFLNSSLFLSVVFSLVFLSNSGTPPSLSFISEFMTITAGLTFFGMSFWIIFLYFFMAFYYSIFLLTSSIMGKHYMSFNLFNLGFSVPLVFMMYNIFWFGLFF